MRKTIFIVTVISVLWAFSVQAQEIFDLNKIRAAEPILDVVRDAPFDVYPLNQFTDWTSSEYLFIGGAAISPDARSLAFYGQFRQTFNNFVTDILCVYQFDANATQCYLTPESMASFGALVWSADSQYIAFTEENIRSGDETDIWIYEVQRRLLHNFTDDGINGISIDDTILIDILPTWNSFDGSLLFFRNVTSAGISPTYEVQRITRDELVARFDERQAAIDVAVQEYNASVESEIQLGFSTQIDETITISPTNLELVTTINHISNGGDLAVSFRDVAYGPTQIDAGGLFLAYAVNHENDISQSGVWLLDLASGTAIPLLTGDNLRTEEPDWVQSVQFASIQWTFDSTGLIIATNNQGATATYNSAYYFNIGAGTLNSILDYGILEDEAAFFSSEVPFFTPDSAVLLPDDTFFYFNRSTRDGLNAAPVPPPPTGSLPTQVTLNNTLTPESRTASSMGFNDEVIRVVLDINIITLSR
jgi:hypothetical protein